MKTTPLISLLVICLAAACDKPAINQPVAVSAYTPNPDPLPGMPGYLPNTLFHTQDGKEVRLYEDLIKNKVVLISFMYTTCNGKCLGISANLLKVQSILKERVGKDINFISITLDPDEDTPEALKEYANDLGAKPGWYFLTGDLRETTSLRKKIGIYDRDPLIDAEKQNHAGILVFGNDKLGRWAACPGMQRPEWIARSILRIMQDAPENTVSSN